MKMVSAKWISLLALCFICVSSNDEQNSQKFCEEVDDCTVQKVAAPLGSSVVLPCTVMTKNLTWVSWVHNPDVKLVSLSSGGLITFQDPRSGRLKVFPNQGSQGNFSVCIDELEESDLGCYRCSHTGSCVQVELVKGTQSQNTWLLIYICAGAAVFILLSFGCYLIFTNVNQGTTNKPTDASIEVAGPSAPPQEIHMPPVQYLQHGVENSVYENDDYDPDNYLGRPSRYHSGAEGVSQDFKQTEPTQSPGGMYPDLNQFNFERAQSQRSKQRFHRELINRLRQASFSRHHYVNQHELRNPRVASPTNHNRGPGKKKAKDNCEYKNPIYNRSTEQLNRL